MIDPEQPVAIHRRLEEAQKQYGLRPGADEFPLMVRSEEHTSELQSH